MARRMLPNGHRTTSPTARSLSSSWIKVELSDLKPNAEGIAIGVQRMADALTVLIRRAYPSWFALQEVWPDEG